MTGEVGPFGSLGQECCPVDANEVGGTGHVVPQGQCSLRVGECRPECGGGRRGTSGLDRGHQGIGQLVGSLCVDRPRTPPGRAASSSRIACPGQCGGDCLVPSPAFAGQQLAVRGLADQGVPDVDLVRDRVAAPDDLRRHRLADSRRQPVGRLVEECGEQWRVHRCTDDRDRIDETTSRRVEGVESLDQDIPERRRQDLRAVKGTSGDELLDVEGVAAGPPHHRLDGHRGRQVTGDPGHLAADVVRAEGRQVEADDPRQSLDLGQPRAQRRIPADVVAAVRGDQHGPRQAATVGEGSDEVQGRAIGPMHILEHEADRAVDACSVERSSHGIEQRGPRQVRRQLAGRLDRLVAEAGQQLHQVEATDVGDRGPGRRLELRPQVVQGSGDRGVWRRAGTERRACARTHDDVRGVRQRGQLADESRLADAGVPDDQGEPGVAVAGSVQRRREAAAFFVPTDEGSTRDATRHEPMIGAARSRPSVSRPTGRDQGMSTARPWTRPARRSATASANAARGYGVEVTRTCAPSASATSSCSSW